MAAIVRADDVCNLGGRTAEGVRKLQREVIMSIRFEGGYSSGEVSRAGRYRRRISEHGHGFPRRTHGEDPKIPITKKAVISLSLEIRKNLDRAVRIRAKSGPRLNAAVHISNAVVIRNVRIIPRVGVSPVSAHRHENVRMSSNQAVPQCK